MAEFRKMYQFTKYIDIQNSKLDHLFPEGYGPGDEETVANDKEQLIDDYAAKFKLKPIAALKIYRSAKYHGYIDSYKMNDRLFVTPKGIDFIYKKLGIKWGMWRDITAHYSALQTILWAVVASVVITNAGYIVSFVRYTIDRT